MSQINQNNPNSAWNRVRSVLEMSIHSFDILGLLMWQEYLGNKIQRQSEK